LRIKPRKNRSLTYLPEIAVALLAYTTWSAVATRFADPDLLDYAALGKRLAGGYFPFPIFFPLPPNRCSRNTERKRAACATGPARDHAIGPTVPGNEIAIIAGGLNLRVRTLRERHRAKSPARDAKGLHYRAVSCSIGRRCGPGLGRSTTPRRQRASPSACFRHGRASAVLRTRHCGLAARQTDRWQPSEQACKSNYVHRAGNGRPPPAPPRIDPHCKAVPIEDACAGDRNRSRLLPLGHVRAHPRQSCACPEPRASTSRTEEPPRLTGVKEGFVPGCFRASRKHARAKPFAAAPSPAPERLVAHTRNRYVFDRNDRAEPPGAHRAAPQPAHPPHGPRGIGSTIRLGILRVFNQVVRQPA